VWRLQLGNLLPPSSTSTPPVGIVSPTIYTKREKPAGKRTATVTRNRICNWSRSCRSCRTGLGNRRDTKVHRARAGNKKFVFILHKNVFSPEPRGELWPHPQKKQLIYDTRQGHGGEIKKRWEAKDEEAYGRARRAKAKSAYSCFLPANPITYLDFMVISTKAGSCRCSKDEGLAGLAGEGRGRQRGRTIGEKFCGVQFCILHLTCHCVPKRKE